jgi:hypothetical protein
VPRECTLGTNDELADSAASTDPRVIAAIRESLDLLASNEAVFALEYGDHVVCFRDVGDVRWAVQRLSQDNLREEGATLFGEFQGVLPEGRRFEVRMAERGEVIRGNIGPAVGDADAINKCLHRPVQINVHATRVGSGRPRYVLLTLPTWPADA